MGTILAAPSEMLKERTEWQHENILTNKSTRKESSKKKAPFSTVYSLLPCITHRDKERKTTLFQKGRSNEDTRELRPVLTFALLA